MAIAGSEAPWLSRRLLLSSEWVERRVAAASGRVYPDPLTTAERLAAGDAHARKLMLARMWMALHGVVPRCRR